MISQIYMSAELAWNEALVRTSIPQKTHTLCSLDTLKPLQTYGIARILISLGVTFVTSNLHHNYQIVYSFIFSG